MFYKSAAFYDAIYSFKDYEAESEKVRGMIEQYKRSPGEALLEVACGTGHHAQYLSEHYQTEGLDLDNGLLEVARQRCPNITFHHADMIDFELGRQFDALTCLFSAIAYVQTIERLNQTVQNFARHLRSGGVAVVEGWLLPEQFHAGHLGAIFVDQPALKIARLNNSSIDGRVSILHFHYLVGTPDGITSFTEDHAVGLFTDAEYRAAFASAKLELHVEMEGLTGRPVYIGIKP